MGPGGQEQFVPETLTTAVHMDGAGSKTLLQALEELEQGVVGPQCPQGIKGPQGKGGP